jgi:hypothetical protein
MTSVTNPWVPRRRGAQRCSSPITRTPTNRSGPAAIAEIVVRSIINRRNTYRAQRRVVDARGAANLPRS